MSKKNLKILMASAEVAPLAKAGGLADVVSSLPPALQKLGIDVRIIMPKYGFISSKRWQLKRLTTLTIKSAGHNNKISLWQGALPGTSTPIYLIGSSYFSAKQIYDLGPNSGSKNAEKFLFFSLAVVKSLSALNFSPDILHCHDYHAALIIDLLKVETPETKIKTIYTIHNLNYQGITDPTVLEIANLSTNSLKTLSEDARNGDINFMAQGILNADLVTTVSPTYAKEITTSFYGARLDNLLRRRKKDLVGILNGIDEKRFDPRHDPLIKENYGLSNLSKKKANKIFLQKLVGLPPESKRPLVGLISRLTWQKGIDLIGEEAIKTGAQFVFLGTGASQYEKHLRQLARRYPLQVSAQIKFDLKLAQQIYAGADIFLMPSRFEPCGLGQMYAMRYGTIPVVRATGGLADTVTSQVGFRFKEFSSVALGRALRRAVKLYLHQPHCWQEMQRAGMKKDFSWRRSAHQYVDLYRKLIK
ncbi:glycogen synthase [Candidatus Parcubacteria bacterium]|nr:MAG: glycogen synthase [Candidatus Parcubacteria bacterium]